MDESRTQQLAYSDLQPEMQDEESRRRKGRKVVAILEHFLGRSELGGLRALDIGSSTGFMSDEIELAGAEVIGVDIDLPGLSRARERFSEHRLVVAAGEHLPFDRDRFDLAVFNHIYEHTLDPVAVMVEIRRILRPGGAVYLGLANRLFPIEPHFKLPFLTYLPPAAADRYVRLCRRGDRYHERLRTPSGLRRLCGGFDIWDYTHAVLAQPSTFAAEEDVSPVLRRVPQRAWRLVDRLLPTYLWIGVKGRGRPGGPPLGEPPRRLVTPPSAS